jgi:hypothetical protein
MAALPVAPFVTPPLVRLPEGLPNASLPSGTYYLDNAFRGKPSTSPDFRVDTYIGDSRRRGNIVSVFILKRSIRRPNSRLNSYTPGYGKGLFLPGFDGWLYRFDCQNDRMQSEIHLSTSAAEPGDSLGMIANGDDPPSRWRSVPGQRKVAIEGQMYWVARVSRANPNEWSHANPGTYGASQIDYACRKF